MRYSDLICALRRARPERPRSQIKTDSLTAARLLARKGRYADASKLLKVAHDRGQCIEPEALDLQARMYAQQGMHLHAESCWLKAQSLDGSNPAYAEALSRLRGTRLPFVRPYGILLSICGLGLFALLFWHIMSFGRSLERRQNTNLDSIHAVRRDVLETGHAFKTRHEELASAVSALETRIHGVHSTLTESLETVPTKATAEEDRKAILSHMDAGLAALARLAERMGEEVDGVAKAQQEARKTESDGFARVDVVLTQLCQSVSQISAEVAKQQGAFVKGQAETAERIEGDVAQFRQLIAQTKREVDNQIKEVRSQLRTGLPPLATATQVSALARSMAALQEQMTHLASVIDEMKASRQVVAPSAGEPADEVDAELEREGNADQDEGAGQ